MDPNSISDSVATDSMVQSDGTTAWPEWGPAFLLVALVVAVLLLFVVGYLL